MAPDSEEENKGKGRQAERCGLSLSFDYIGIRFLRKMSHIERSWQTNQLVGVRRLQLGVVFCQDPFGTTETCNPERLSGKIRPAGRGEIADADKARRLV